ncbi:MAG TPA: hypothetical protein VFX30_09750 [bacterium]|nr:hypothetical protein [bacterium]
MQLTALNPILAASALSAFRAHPETGRMSVPLVLQTDGTLASEVVSRSLSESTLRMGVLNALAVMRSASEEPWERSLLSQPHRVHFENIDEGRAVHLELGTSQANAFADSAQGLLISCRRFGAFGETVMNVALDPHQARPHLNTGYELEWSEAGLLGLKKLLGWNEDLPVYDVALRLFHHLSLQGDPTPRNPYEELGENSLKKEWSGTHPNGAFVTILGGPDDALYQSYGDYSERLRLEISPSQDPPMLPASLLPFWAYADQVAQDSNLKNRQEAVVEDRELYRKWANRVYEGK